MSFSFFIYCLLSINRYQYCAVIMKREESVCELCYWKVKRMFTGPDGSPRRHSSVDEILGLSANLSLNGQRQRSLSDSGSNDKDTVTTNGNGEFTVIVEKLYFSFELSILDKWLRCQYIVLRQVTTLSIDFKGYFGTNDYTVLFVVYKLLHCN